MGLSTSLPEMLEPLGEERCRGYRKVKREGGCWLVFYLFLFHHQREASQAIYLFELRWQVHGFQHVASRSMSQPGQLWEPGQGSEAYILIPVLEQSRGNQ